MSACAWVTLATNDSYSLGALVLAHSLRKVGTVHQLAVMVTPGVTSTMREQLRSAFDLVHEVNVLDSNDASNLALLARPELGITFTKLHCWSLTQYTKCVFMDADTLVLQACDELFDREELSAAPDVGWPDCFNSGVFVFKPSLDTFKNLVEFALSRGSFDGGDQGLLNLFFSDWATQDASRRLPFIYNMCSTAVYSYLPAFKQFGNDAKIVHFIGQVKPWLLELDTQSGLVTPSPGYEHLRPILQQWWSLFLGEVLPKLQPDMGGMAGALAQLSIGSPRSEQQIALEQHWRRQAWEHGNADYLGKDAFDKIWQKIQNTLQGVEPPASGDAPPAPAPPPPVEAQAPSPPVETAPAAPVEVPSPTTTPSEPTPREVVTTPASVAPSSPAPGDKKTPVQPPPSASASKPEPLAANRPTAPPVSQTAPACTLPFKLADLPLSSHAKGSSIEHEVMALSFTTLDPDVSLSSTVETSTSTHFSPTAQTPILDPVSPIAKLQTPPPLSPTAKPQTSPPLSPTAKPQTSPPVSPTAKPQTSPPLSPTTKPQTSPPLSPTAKPQTSPPLSPTAKPQTSPPLSPTAKPQTSPPLSPTAKPQTSPPLSPTAKPQTSPSLSPTSHAPKSPPLSPFTKFTTSPPIVAAIASKHIVPLDPMAPPVAKPRSPPSKSPSTSPIPRVAQPIPRTPIVTAATPPTSPPIGPPTRSHEALGGGNVTPPETPPIGSGGNMQAAADNQSGAESAPIPPKRRGGPNKGGKSGQKGKK